MTSANEAALDHPALLTPRIWKLTCAPPPLQRILVCGWGEAAFMASVLRELDHGPAALPAGSEVVLFNQHDPPDQLPSVRGGH